MAKHLKRKPAASSGLLAERAVKRQRTKTTASSIVDVKECVASVLREIPIGRTRSKMEVFRAALEKLGRGDEAIGTGTRTVLGGHLKALVSSRAEGWHRVVASDGGFWDSPASAAVQQLKLLRQEGARPRVGESVPAWAARVGATRVGCYRPSSSGGRLHVPPDDPVASRWAASLVEPLSGEKEAAERRHLSGGKLFWSLGQEKPQAPCFRVDSDRLRKSESSSVSFQNLAKRALATREFELLKQHGVVCLRKFISSRYCAELLHYAEHGSFCDVTRLDGEAGECGRYEFCVKTPARIDELRSAVYSRLVELSPDLSVKHGKDLATLEKACRRAGQARPATIFLAYGEGGVNLAHQDPYGTVFFPYQMMLMLSRRNRDFAGGAFFVKDMSTGKAVEVEADEGDLTIFAANKHAVNGADFKHGVRPLCRTKGGSCERFSVGLVFNLRK
eukprot:TRINITY_DN46600_c0_g1_i1.p1 TRINITY_DN46600_c0_g1~~TRINITY_DN46600_c0_g1_i1.p1  ORF type:complete len:447 (-),score=60.15 TRINITY_DN46600_c0_g1_i1:41-1381(-)